MTYRAVVRHVRYWRGAVHKWSTVYQFVGTATSTPSSTDCQNILTLDDAMCYPSVAADGGTYECDIYNQSSGGVPIASYSRFAWNAPGSWIGYGGSGWTTTALGFNGDAEACTQVRWIMGLSSSGKPVYARKYFHATPPTAVAGAAAQISGSDLTSLAAKATLMTGVMASKGLVLGSSAGRFAGVASVEPYFVNHQMSKGRKRKALVTADGRYTGPTIQVPQQILED